MTFHDSSESTQTFGAGGDEPYANALRGNAPVTLVGQIAQGALLTRTTMDVSRWNADADETDLSLLRAATGPLLDIGCGPGRMVRAARDVGLEVLGIDVSATAIEIAREAGLDVVQGSVFETVPREGEWQTALLVDGNVGIGGDVTALVERCTQLLTPTGDLVVELHRDASRDIQFTATLLDAEGRESESFPWAEIGLDAITRIGASLGLGVRHSWVSGDRAFARLSAA